MPHDYATILQGNLLCITQSILAVEFQLYCSHICITCHQQTQVVLQNNPKPMLASCEMTLRLPFLPILCHTSDEYLAFPCDVVRLGEPQSHQTFYGCTSLMHYYPSKEQCTFGHHCLRFQDDFLVH